MTHTERERCPYLATDMIIEYNDGKKSGIVLIERKNSPLGLALPGGFAVYGLTLEENARKEAREETGLEFFIYEPEQPLCVHSQPDRDPRSHVVSVTYVGRGEGILCAGDDAKKAHLYTRERVQELLKDGAHRFAFPDHIRILEKYLANVDKNRPEYRR